MSSTKANPLPLSETLRDLALLRASDLDLSSLLPVEPAPAAAGEAGAINVSVERSYTFAKEARAAIKLLYRGDVDAQGARVEELRSQLEEVQQGLESSGA